MGTGSLAVTISNFPFPFTGQQGIALAIWSLNVALFLLFLGLLVGRAACYPGSLMELLEVPNQSLFLGTLPMSISAITAGLHLLLVPRCGDVALMAGYGLLWLNLPIVAVVALLIPMYMFSVQDHSMQTMTALWLIPVIPGTTAAAVTGAVAGALLPDDKAHMLLYLGLCMLAVGGSASHHVLTIYYQRLICHSLPPREVIVSSFIPVGAVGMAGWALLNLAHAADTHLRAHLEDVPTHLGRTELLDAVLPAALAAAGVLGLSLWAISGWWLILAVSSVGQTMRQGIPFTLGYWGSVFPVGTFAGTTLALGSFFHTRPFKILGAVVACCQVAVWLFVTGMTLYKGLAGDLFHPPCLAPPPPAADERQMSAKVSQLESRLSQTPTAVSAGGIGMPQSSMMTPFAMAGMGQQDFVWRPQSGQLPVQYSGGVVQQQPSLRPSSGGEQLQRGGPSPSSLQPLSENGQWDELPSLTSSKDVCEGAAVAAPTAHQMQPGMADSAAMVHGACSSKV